MSSAIDDVLAERQRQIEVEGWTEAHDDDHYPGDMAMAGACYAAHAACGAAIERGDFDPHSRLEAAQQLVRRMWPWGREWWKPKNNRRDMVRAAALMIAEIERWDRAMEPVETPPETPNKEVMGAEQASPAERPA